MHSQKNLHNILSVEIKENGWFRRKLPFKSVTADDILDFSEMTEKD